MVLPVPTPPHMYSPRGGRACMGALRPPKMLCHLRARGRTHAALDAETSGERPAASINYERLCKMPEMGVPIWQSLGSMAVLEARIWSPPLRSITHVAPPAAARGSDTGGIH